MARREYQDPPLKTTTTGRPKWYIRYRERVIGKDGKPTRKPAREYFGLVAEVGEREAKKRRAAKLAEINGQLYDMPSHILLSEFVKLFEEKYIPTLDESTQAKYKYQIKNHILPQFGAWKLSDITTEQIQGFLNRCEAKLLSRWTCLDLRSILSGLFSRADEWGYWTERNPVEKTKIKRRPAKREKRILSDEDTARFIDALPEPCNLVALTCALTGMRISEVIGLKWSRVDFTTGWIEVRERRSRYNQGLVKTEKSNRDLPICDLVMRLSALKARQEKSGPDHYVFQNEKGGSLDYDNLRWRHIVPIAKRLGLYFEGFGFHSLRRGLITGVQAVGGSAIEAQGIAGHSRPDMTAEYSFTSRARREELVRAYQERLKGARGDDALQGL